jgi:hydroxymethylpyrimidine pyrophosphatase-like HAD family hydrolase
MVQSSFGALAIDYDGTLTTAARPEQDVLDAIREVREGGVHVFLVTGRILSELRADFPEVDDHFDAIVAENGGVLARGGKSVLLARPVDKSLENALRASGVPLRRGEVILATDGMYDTRILGAVERLELEVQLVFNRGALMLIPHDVTKGSGIVRALADAGFSPHDTVAIGDAENDHSLLDSCEIGVAVGNAVEALKAHAEIVLDDVAGAAVASFLRGPFRRGLPGVHSPRWKIRIGVHSDDGSDVMVPASRVNLGIFGESGQGKSYLAGLIAEQLTGLGYTICVLDLEGDHLGLTTLPGVIHFGGSEAPPSPARLGTLFREGLGSAVIDLSMQDIEAKREYAIKAFDVLQHSRGYGRAPHWIFLEEAHVPLADGNEALRHPKPGTTGLCIVSYRRAQICEESHRLTDIEFLCEGAGLATIRRYGYPARPFVPAERVTAHERHWHKYISGTLPAERRFVFRTIHGATGESAGKPEEFHDVLGRSDAAVLVHHASHGDFSRWIGDLSHDPRLSANLREVEEKLRAGPCSPEWEQTRRMFLDVIESCYKRRDA